MKDVASKNAVAWEGIRTRKQYGIELQVKQFKQEIEKEEKKSFDNPWKLGCHVRVDEYIDNAVLSAALADASSFHCF